MELTPADIRVVLVETSHPGNIGAVARAMKNMGLSQLVLVRPRSFPDPEASARASGATDVLARARVVGTPRWCMASLQRNSRMEDRSTASPSAVRE